jgi:hypothetical protein
MKGKRPLEAQRPVLRRRVSTCKRKMVLAGEGKDHVTDTESI